MDAQQMQLGARARPAEMREIGIEGEFAIAEQSGAPIEPAADHGDRIALVEPLDLDPACGFLLCALSPRGRSQGKCRRSAGYAHKPVHSKTSSGPPDAARHPRPLVRGLFRFIEGPKTRGRWSA